MLSKELGEIVVPTRLSVLGLLNIQDTSADLPPTINNGGWRKYRMQRDALEADAMTRGLCTTVRARAVRAIQQLIS